MLVARARAWFPEKESAWPRSGTAASLWPSFPDTPTFGPNSTLRARTRPSAAAQPARPGAQSGLRRESVTHLSCGRWRHSVFHGYAKITHVAPGIPASPPR